MKFIAIETATSVCGIAYIEDGQCVSRIEQDIPRAHAEKLPVYFDELMSKNDIRLSDIDAVAVSVGPGSFTGLRIGLSYAKGIAYSHNLPIIPVPTLFAMAEGTQLKEDVSILLHSHADTYFYQQFHWKINKLSPAESPIAVTKDDFSKLFDRSSAVYFCGSDKKAEELKEFNFKKIKPSVKWVGELAEKFVDDWMVVDPKSLTPEYISPFQFGHRK